MKIILEAKSGSEFQKTVLKDMIKVLYTIKDNFEHWHKRNKFDITIEED